MLTAKLNKFGLLIFIVVVVAILGILYAYNFFSPKTSKTKDNQATQSAEKVNPILNGRIDSINEEDRTFVFIADSLDGKKYTVKVTSETVINYLEPKSGVQKLGPDGDNVMKFGELKKGMSLELSHNGYAEKKTTLTALLIVVTSK